MGRTQERKKERGSRSIRTAILLALTSAAALTAPATAGAATVALTGTGGAQRITYTGEATETNTVTVTNVAGQYRFDDGLAVTITPGAGCTLDAGDVLCTAPAATPVDATAEIQLNLGAGDDTATATVPDATTDVTMNGGPGNDTLTGFGGRFVLMGGTENDRLNGGPNADQLYGVSSGGTPDNLTKSGGDYFKPGGGADLMVGGSGDDTFDRGEALDTGSGDQIASAGAGSDTITFADRDKPVLYNSDPDVNVPFGGDAGGIGKTPRQDLLTNPSNDVERLVGGHGDDLLIGSEHGDTLEGGQGKDIMCGALGSDTIDYSSEPGPVRATLQTPDDLPADPRIKLPSGSGPNSGIWHDASNQILVTTFDPHDLKTGDQVGLKTGDHVAIKWSHDSVNTDDDPATANPPDWTITVVDRPDNPATPFREDLHPIQFVLNGSTFDSSMATAQRGDGSVHPLDHGPTRNSACAVAIDDDGGEVDAQDCLFDDGLVLPGGGVEGDCIGELTENVIGSNFNDTLVGSDPVWHRNPDENVALDKKSQVSGENVLSGCGGDDLLVGGLGADVFEGDAPSLFKGFRDGACHDPNAAEGGFNDTVTYTDAGPGKDQPRQDPVQASINGVKDDGTSSLDTEFSADAGAGDGSPLRPSFDSITTGIDHVIGGSGNDHLTTQSPATLEGKGGNDVMEGSAGDDTLLGGDSDDSIDGSGGNDSVFGEAGNDSLTGGPGSDLISGGDGIDLADYSVNLRPVTVTADGQPGDGTAGEGDNVQSDVESLNGGLDNDALAAGPGDGVVNGGGGNDSLDGGAGADTLIGGEGIDTASYASRGGPVTVSLGVPGGDGEGGENDNVTSDVENVSGGSANDTLTGDGAANQLGGGGGEDNLSGGGGFDNLLGGPGNDLLFGGDASDLLGGGDGTDTLNGEGGDDTMNGNAGDDRLDGGPGADKMAAGGGKDTVTYASRSADVEVTLDGNANDGVANENDFVQNDVASVTTGGGDDLINSIDGLSGDISCGGGSDSVQVDNDDDVANNCESIVVGKLSSTRCRVSSSFSVTRTSMTVRFTCPVAAKGTMTLETARTYKKSHRSSVLRLGKKSFTTKSAGQSMRLKVKLSKDAVRFLRRHTKVRVRAKVKAKPRGVASSSKKSLTASKTLTVKKKKG